MEELNKNLPVEPYNPVFSYGVIYHTAHPDRAIEQIKKYLAVDGELRLMVYSKVNYKLFWIMKEEGIWDMGRLDELIAENSDAQTGCPVTYTYTFNEVKSLLNGFEILEMCNAHILHGKLPRTNNMSTKRTRHGQGLMRAKWQNWKRISGCTLLYAPA